MCVSIRRRVSGRAGRHPAPHRDGPAGRPRHGRSQRRRRAWRDPPPQSGPPAARRRPVRGSPGSNEPSPRTLPPARPPGLPHAPLLGPPLAPRACLATLRAEPGIVVRTGPRSGTQRSAHALEHRARRLRKRRLVQRRVDLRRRPARQREARRHRPIALRTQTVNRQARPALRRTALRHLDPHLGEAPRLVEAQLAATHVGGVVHLQQHVRQVVRPHFDGCTPRPRLHRVEIDHLVRLQDAPPLAPVVAQQQVCRAERQDGRPPDRGHPRQQPGELLARPLVVDGGRLARHPRRLGRGIPVLDATLVVADGVAGDADGAAAGELGGGIRRVAPSGSRGPCRDHRSSVAGWRGDAVDHRPCYHAGPSRLRGSGSWHAARTPPPGGSTGLAEAPWPYGTTTPSNSMRMSGRTRRRPRRTTGGSTP